MMIKPHVVSAATIFGGDLAVNLEKARTALISARQAVSDAKAAEAEAFAALAACPQETLDRVAEQDAYQETCARRRSAEVALWGAEYDLRWQAMEYVGIAPCWRPAAIITFDHKIEDLEVAYGNIVDNTTVRPTKKDFDGRCVLIRTGPGYWKCLHFKHPATDKPA